MKLQVTVCENPLFKEGDEYRFSASVAVEGVVQTQYGPTEQEATQKLLEHYKSMDYRLKTVEVDDAG